MIDGLDVRGEEDEAAAESGCEPVNSAADRGVVVSGAGGFQPAGGGGEDLFELSEAEPRSERCCKRVSAAVGQFSLQRVPGDTFARGAGLRQHLARAGGGIGDVVVRDSVAAELAGRFDDRPVQDEPVEVGVVEVGLPVKCGAT